MKEGSDACSQAPRRTRAIRHYQAARWLIGAARRHLPPQHELNTRPADLREIDLPSDLTEAVTAGWAGQQIAAYRQRIESCLGPEAIEQARTRYADQLSEGFLSTAEVALLWCSGKDLLAALGPRLLLQGEANAGAFRARLRDWVRSHQAETLVLLPEVAQLVNLLRG